MSIYSELFWIVVSTLGAISLSIAALLLADLNKRRRDRERRRELTRKFFHDRCPNPRRLP